MDASFETLRTWGYWLVYSDLGRACAAAAVLFYLLVWWRILARAGFPGGLAFLMLVPPFALGVWSFLAFAPWPSRRELHALRKVQHVLHQAERRRLIA